MDRYYDNTRLSEFKRCPRKFYFRHVRDLIPEGASAVPLVFGSAWHNAMDTLWGDFAGAQGQNLTPSQVGEHAYEAFMEKWIEEGLPPMEELTGILSMKLKDLDDDQRQYAMRNPMTAKEMLYEYAEERQSFLTSKDFSLISIEQPFAVPLDPSDDTLFYVGRMDKVFRWRGDVYIGEHKTTSAYKLGGPFRPAFLESFSPDAQIDGYLHAGHMLYGEELKGVWVDAALVHKTVHNGFKFIPIERQTAQLDAWLWEVRNWVDLVEGNASALGGSQEPYMASYAKNTNSCWDFNKSCEYMYLCKMWANPERRDEVPMGYKKEHWSPYERLELGTIGMEEQIPSKREEVSLA